MFVDVFGDVFGDVFVDVFVDVFGTEAHSQLRHRRLVAQARRYATSMQHDAACCGNFIGQLGF